MSVLGIDPGLSGAFCVVEGESIVFMADMPTWKQALKSGKLRERLNPVDLGNMVESFKMMGVELAILEAVGGRPRQSASAAFQFGYVVGCVYMALVQARIPIDMIEPANWKRLMRCPTNDEGIARRADELFPEHRHLWRGAKGGVKHDRAEAAMLARFGQDFALNGTYGKKRDLEAIMNYRDARIGG